jgi:hypothetical protein
MDSVRVIDFWVSGRWSEKPQFIKLAKVNGEQLDGFSYFYSQCTLSIDDAFGDQLDLIGEIIQCPRILVPDDLFAFGYEGTEAAGGYNEAPYFDPDAVGHTPIIDDYYKLVLKAKVLFNVTECTRTSVIFATRFLFGVEDIEVVDNEDMKFSIKIHGVVDNLIIKFLNEYKYNIKAGGVKFLGYEAVS